MFLFTVYFLQLFLIDAKIIKSIITNAKQQERLDYIIFMQLGFKWSWHI